MKKRLKLLVVLFIFCIGWDLSYAKEGIYSIDIDVHIKENGDANITEIWSCESYSGTEWYHPYYNLGNANIIDLSVKENDKEYTLLSRWNTSGSQSYKKEKCGLNKISNGIEICWGMGDYGNHVYEVSYTITNFVDNLNDAQMVYWTLIPHGRSDKVDNASIKIRADKVFSDNVEVWGFGEEGGICRVNNGIIEIKSKNTLKISEYITVLVKFPVEFFDSNNNSNQNFDYYYNMANEGVYSNKLKNFFENNYTLMCIILFVIFYFVSSLFSYLLAIISSGLNKLVKHPILLALYFIGFAFLVQYIVFAFLWLFIMGILADKLIKEDKVIKGVIRESQVPYYRDIPCDGDIFKIYYIAYQYGIIKNKTDLLGAVILKWIKEKRASVLDKNSNSKSDSITLSRDYNKWNWNNIHEKQLYQMMLTASHDGVLEKKELQKWCRKKHNDLFTWFKNIMVSEQNELIENEAMFVDIKWGKKKFTATDELYEDGKKICGLKKYLKDFTLIHEREAVEVKLFEDYLIIAQMLGIAKKVIKQFNDLYPKVIEESCFEYSDYIFVHTTAHRTIRSAYHARTSSNIGGSRGGGGGGSRGGGGGGGGRR